MWADTPGPPQSQLNGNVVVRAIAARSEYSLAIAYASPFSAFYTVEVSAD